MNNNSKKQKSQNWDEWEKKSKEFYGNKQRIPGFPFDEKWPKFYLGKKYELIDVNGEKYTARVDDSREYMSEGLEWKTIGENRQGNLTKYVIVAWREI